VWEKSHGLGCTNSPSESGGEGVPSGKQLAFDAWGHSFSNSVDEFLDWDAARLQSPARGRAAAGERDSGARSSCYG